MTRAAVVLVLFALVACGGNDDSTEGVETTATEGTSTPDDDRGSECEDVPGFLRDAIEASLTVSGGGTLGETAAVRSGDFEQVWFVSGEIDGAGLEGSGDVATWATNGLDAPGLVYSVDAVAEEFSDWGSGGATDAGLSMADDGAEESRDCL